MSAHEEAETTERRETAMNKKIVAVNAGPRMGWNTETLISEAERGARAAGAVVELSLIHI